MPAPARPRGCVRSHALLPVLFTLTLFPASAAGLVLPRHGTAEIALQASQVYDGAQGTPNPFTDVSLSLRVTTPRGRVVTVPGYFDGDGAGGQSGSTFAVRVYADEIGTWSWVSISTDPGLHGQSGSFDVSGTLPGRWGRGALRARPSVPRHFTHADGTPLFLAGKFLDDAAAGGASTRTQPMFSETWSDADRQAILDRAAGQSLNKIAVYVANIGDYGGTQPTTPWLGSSSSSDRTRFDLSRWRTYDSWTRQMRDLGFATQLWLFADDSGFGDLPDADRQRLIAYTMARLSAFANTSFVLALEWEEGWTTAEVDFHASYLQTRNPWGRPVSVHGTDGPFDFPTRSWATFMAIQSGLTVAHPDTHATNLESHALAQKPLIDEELTNGTENLGGRQKTWAAFTAGVAGLGTGAGFPALMALAAELDVPRLAPDDALVLAGNATAIAERGRAYVVHLPEGGSVTLDLAHTTGSFQARWLDPSSGAFQGQGDVQGGASVVFSAPNGNGADWVLHLWRPCPGPGTPGAVSGLRPSSPGAITWAATAGADGYDAIAGDLQGLRSGGPQASVLGCLEVNGGDLSAEDPEAPPPGGGRYYLVRARHCSGTVGTYDGISPALDGSRDVPAAQSGNDCP